MRPNEIVRILRNRIIGGEFPPGSALPLRHKLLKEFDISVATFQKCINRLTEEGFLKSKGAKGTFVTEYPPHLYEYALVFPEEKEILLDTFYPALRKASKLFADTMEGVRFRNYYVGTNEHFITSDMDLLISHAQNHLFAGILFVFFAPRPEIQKALRPCPCVVISRLKADSKHDYPSLEFDSESLLSCCLESLKAKGCKRIATLVSANISTKRLLRMQQMLDPMPKEWMLGINHFSGRPLLNKNIIRLLLNKSKKERPDGLAVLNENFMPLVMEVIEELGLRVGKDIQFAAHSNYPVCMEQYPDVEYYAFSSLKVLKTAFALLKENDSKKIKQVKAENLRTIIKKGELK